MAARKSYSPALKAKAVLELPRDEKPRTQVAAEYGVHPNQLRRWKHTVIDQLHKARANDARDSTGPSGGTAGHPLVV